MPTYYEEQFDRLVEQGCVSAPRAVRTLIVDRLRKGEFESVEDACRQYGLWTMVARVDVETLVADVWKDHGHKDGILLTELVGITLRKARGLANPADVRDRLRRLQETKGKQQCPSN